MANDNIQIIPVNATQRKKIWELEKSWHCSIIGTCLSMYEARKIGRKFGATCSDPSQIDAVVHAMLVRDCAQKNEISILLIKQKKGRPNLLLGRYKNLGQLGLVGKK